MSEAFSSSASPAADPTDPYEREAQTFPRLSEEQIERARAFGRVEDLTEGTQLLERGQRSVDFFIVLEGRIEIYEPGGNGPHVLRSHEKKVNSPARSICSMTATSWSATAWGWMGASCA